MKFLALALAAAAAVTANGTVLTPDNFEAETAGKTIFVKVRDGRNTTQHWSSSTTCARRS